MVQLKTLGAAAQDDPCRGHIATEVDQLDLSGLEEFSLSDETRDLSEDEKEEPRREVEYQEGEETRQG